MKRKRKNKKVVERLLARRPQRKGGCYPEGGVPGPGSYPTGGLPGRGCYPERRGPGRGSARSEAGA